MQGQTFLRCLAAGPGTQLGRIPAESLGAWRSSFQALAQGLEGDHRSSRRCAERVRAAPAVRDPKADVGVIHE
jgi:hypothetical protein